MSFVRLINWVITFLWAGTTFTYAQTLAVAPGVGVGNVVNGKTAHHQGKGLFLFDIDYQPSDHWAVGLTLGFGGNLFPGTNTEETARERRLSATDNRTRFALLKTRYTIGLKTIQPFISIGVGGNTYSMRVFAQNTDQVSRTNFAIAPAIGFEVKGTRFGLMYLVGGRTPAFSGQHDASQAIILEGQSMGLLLLTARFMIPVLR